jgi:SAM-dependent methyltransferase
MTRWPPHPRQWDLNDSPLRPCDADIEIVEAAVAASGRPVRGLVLGVTPELIGMHWPAGSRVTAVDSSAVMIAKAVGAPATFVRADWRALPLAEASVDLAVGDGSISCLSFPREYEQVADELARALVPGGQLVLRLFASPPIRETVADVVGALAAGAIGSMHVLKWRVAMAVADGHDIPLAEIGRVFEDVIPDPAAFAAASGWPIELVESVKHYKRASIVLSFPTADEALEALAPRFALVSRHTPGYELGERCPTVVLTRRA